MTYHLHRPIQIAEYDPQWPARYEMERQVLHAALGPLALQIEHIGSTSVPGLAAKPIIDISVSMQALIDVDACAPALLALGYVDARIDPAFQRRLFCKGPYNEGTHHVHITVHGSTIWPNRFSFGIICAPTPARRPGMPASSAPVPSNTRMS
jgi:GrpB-like predicted nucleotidyltransferase (UPF0157 family)